MNRIGTLWIGIRSSLWFIPTVMLLLASGLAFWLLEVDSKGGRELEEWWPRFFGVGAEGSRTLLSAIATSMITLAGVTFSITIVALSLAANQYSPRVLRNFMRDRSNQVVLGAFVSIFAYCLIVLRTVQGDKPFIPSISITAALVLSVIGAAVFIYFIHHVASSIQASSILSSIAEETLASLEEVFPEPVGNEPGELEGTIEEQALLREEQWHSVAADCSGYIQSVDADGLIESAAKWQVVIRLDRSVGEFVSEGCPIASVTLRQPSEKMVRHLNRLFGINSYRTIEQDPGFGIRQLVDVAVKALSPGINDPTTAVYSLDRLEEILRKLLQRRIPSPFRYHEGQLRVIARGPSFEFLVDQMFHELRLNSRGSFFVVCRMLDILSNTSACARMPARREVLRRQARLIAEEAKTHFQLAFDREIIKQRLQEIEDLLRPG